MRISCHLKVITNPRLLSLDALPEPGLALSGIDSQVPHLALFSELLAAFNKEGDPLLTAVVEPFLGGEELTVPVVATQGVPEPYDAWCNEVEGAPVVLFNLSLWDEADLKRAGLRVIIHEITHFLLARIHGMLLPGASAVERLDYLVFDEGLAHFLGFPGSRDGIHRQRRREWEKAEELLALARARMAKPGLTGQEVEDCLRKASTGSYWEKFGSVAGLCRASQLHERGGVSALVESIRNKNLALS